MEINLNNPTDREIVQCVKDPNLNLDLIINFFFRAVFLKILFLQFYILISKRTI